MNQDGFGDVAIGFPNFRAKRGRIYVYAGSSQGLQKNPIWSYTGKFPGAGLGYTLAAKCDWNQDGFLDLAVSSPFFRSKQTSVGRVDIFLGKKEIFPFLPSASLIGQDDQAAFGHALLAGKLTAENAYPQLLISAPYATTRQVLSGKVYIFGGQASGIASQPRLTLEGDRDHQKFGYALAVAKPDLAQKTAALIVGAPGEGNQKYQAGSLFVFAGGPGQQLQKIPSQENYGNFGYALCAAGDWDKDGFAELLASQPGYSGSQLFQGRVGIFTLSQQGLSAKPLRIWEGPQADARLGQTLAVGDLDADGRPDLLLGAPWLANGKRERCGQVFLILGRPLP
jgi:hypothetical protein